MKVLIGITYYYPNVSGVSIYAKRLAEGLAKKGHEVKVLTSWYDKSLPKREKIGEVEIIRCPVSLKIGKGVFMLSLPLNIYSLAKNVDVINCHLPQFESFIFAVIGKLLGKKVILTHHTDLSGWKGIFNRVSESTVWFGQIVAGIFADKLVPYTKDYADNSWYLQLFKNKLKYVLPPIVTDKIDSEKKKNMSNKIGKTKYIVGFAGRFAKQKGIPYLLNSIPFLEKRLGSFKIVFAGPYEGIIGEKYFEEIDSLIKKYTRYLCFLGSLNQEEMSVFYNLCNVLVLPSDDRLESFGLVQVEAMLNGCPVVATDLPGARMPVKMSGMGLIVPPACSQSLAQAMVEVLLHRDKFVRTKKEIAVLFDFQKTVDEYEELFLTSK